ncbi:unnamed protein product, partial [Prorocentrum cordatum]
DRPRCQRQRGRGRPPGLRAHPLRGGRGRSGGRAGRHEQQPRLPSDRLELHAEQPPGCAGRWSLSARRGDLPVFGRDPAAGGARQPGAPDEGGAASG